MKNQIDFPIQKFGSKLMVAGKSVNNIPEHYLSYAQNARIYDGGIWPRKGKELLTDSTVGTRNQGGFIMNNKLYQIANSNIYEIDKSIGTQTLIAALWYDALTDVLVYGDNIAIIASNWQSLKVFDGTTVSTPATVPASNSGIIEYCRGYSFLASKNVLYISRPISATTPTYAYDFTGTGSQNITFDWEIKGLKSTMDWLYIFTDSKVEYLGANALQNVAGSATFVSAPIGNIGYPINNLCITASGDKIFWLSQSMQIQTVNYIQGTSTTQIWELSMRPVISINEILKELDSSQPTAFSWFNEQDKTIQFNVRSQDYPYNDKTIVYDMINDTWGIDTGKNYNYVVRDWFDYYGFSDVNTSIYKENTGNSNAGDPIDFYISTNNLMVGTFRQKLFRGFFTQWWIGSLTSLEYKVYIDWEIVFQDTIEWDNSFISELWEIGWAPVGDEEIGWGLSYFANLKPYDIIADEWRIYTSGIRMYIEVSSTSQQQDFIIDRMWCRATITGFSDTTNKF